MPRRRDALRHLQALTEAGATPAQRLVTLVVLAHADADNCATVSARAIGELCQYGTRHVQSTIKELVESGLLVQLKSVGPVNTYRVETANPRPLSVSRQASDVTIEDVLDLLRHHACVMGFDVPSYMPAPNTRRAVSSALSIYGQEKCEIAHYGHLYRVNHYPEQARYKTFKFAYPNKGGELDREWFEGIISDGVELQRQAKRAKLKEARERADAEVRERERRRCRSDEGREIGKKRAREILSRLSSTQTCVDRGSAGSTRGPVSIGSVCGAVDGQGAPATAATAESPSSDSD